MTLTDAALPGPSPSSSAVFVPGPTDLRRVTRPGVNLAVWERSLPERERQAFERVAATQANLRVRMDLGDDPTDFRRFVSAVDEPVARDAMVRDLSLLLPAFLSLLEQHEAHAELRVVTSDMCRKFHADRVPLRLLTTYAGPGTEWVDDRDVHRGALLAVGVAADVANRGVLRRADAVRVASVGDVLLMKGHSWPGNAGRGAIHRSPPVEGAKERRLLLKLDAYALGA